MRPIQSSPRRLSCLLVLLLLTGEAVSARADDPLRAVPLNRRLTHVQPMTGIVFWATSQHNRSEAIQLEYSYMKYNDIVKTKGTYDWSAMDRLLEGVAGRGHQAIVRFYFVYPGRDSTVPDYIKASPGYREARGKSEGRPTTFCDWSHPELRRFTLDFYAELAKRYDRDPRLAFLETGFGLWAEYHIYDGPMELGKTFPDKAFQAEFARHLARVFERTPWMISVDAADEERAPYAGNAELLGLRFGVFDDSFLCRQHKTVNELNWNVMGRDRWKLAPAGGEFSYYTRDDQKNALAPDGPHGISFEKAADAFHITFMIGDGQPRHRGMDRIREAGMACGYRLRVLEFMSNERESRVTITNTGIAPLYHDAFIAVNGTRAAGSLRGLLPGERRGFTVGAGGTSPKLTVACDRLVPGQEIEFEADLER